MQPRERYWRDASNLILGTYTSFYANRNQRIVPSDSNFLPWVCNMHNWVKYRVPVSTHLIISASTKNRLRLPRTPQIHPRKMQVLSSQSVLKFHLKCGQPVVIQSGKHCQFIVTIMVTINWSLWSINLNTIHSI